jgi:hypothetical protein
MAWIRGLLILDLSLPCLWSGAGLAAEGFGEVTGVGETCGRGYVFKIPVVGSKEDLDDIDAALEDVSVWRNAGAAAKCAGEVKDTQVGY